MPRKSPDTRAKNRVSDSKQVALPLAAQQPQGREKFVDDLFEGGAQHARKLSAILLERQQLLHDLKKHKPGDDAYGQIHARLTDVQQRARAARDAQDKYLESIRDRYGQDIANEVYSVFDHYHGGQGTDHIRIDSPDVLSALRTPPETAKPGNPKQKKAPAPASPVEQADVKEAAKVAQGANTGKPLGRPKPGEILLQDDRITIQMAGSPRKKKPSPWDVLWQMPPEPKEITEDTDMAKKPEPKKPEPKKPEPTKPTKAEIKSKIQPPPVKEYTKEEIAQMNNNPTAQVKSAPVGATQKADDQARKVLADALEFRSKARSAAEKGLVVEANRMRISAEHIEATAEAHIQKIYAGAGLDDAGAKGATRKVLGDYDVLVAKRGLDDDALDARLAKQAKAEVDAPKGKLASLVPEEEAPKPAPAAAPAPKPKPEPKPVEKADIKAAAQKAKAPLAKPPALQKGAASAWADSMVEEIKKIADPENLPRMLSKDAEGRVKNSAGPVMRQLREDIDAYQKIRDARAAGADYPLSATSNAASRVVATASRLEGVLSLSDVATERGNVGLSAEEKKLADELLAEAETYRAEAEQLTAQRTAAREDRRAKAEQFKQERAAKAGEAPAKPAAKAPAKPAVQPVTQADIKEAAQVARQKEKVARQKEKPADAKPAQEAAAVEEPDTREADAPKKAPEVEVPEAEAPKRGEIVHTPEYGARQRGKQINPDPEPGRARPMGADPTMHAVDRPTRKAPPIDVTPVADVLPDIADGLKRAAGTGALAVAARGVDQVVKAVPPIAGALGLWEIDNLADEYLYPITHDIAEDMLQAYRGQSHSADVSEAEDALEQERPDMPPAQRKVVAMYLASHPDATPEDVNGFVDRVVAKAKEAPNPVSREERVSRTNTAREQTIERMKQENADARAERQPEPYPGFDDLGEARQLEWASRVDAGQGVTPEEKQGTAVQPEGRWAWRSPGMGSEYERRGAFGANGDQGAVWGRAAQQQQQQQQPRPRPTQPRRAAPPPPPKTVHGRVIQDSGGWSYQIVDDGDIRIVTAPQERSGAVGRVYAKGSSIHSAISRDEAVRAKLDDEQRKLLDVPDAPKESAPAKTQAPVERDGKGGAPREPIQQSDGKPLPPHVQKAAERMSEKLSRR